MYKIVAATGTEWTLDDIDEMSARIAELNDCKKRLEVQENRIDEDIATIDNLNILNKSLEKALVNECNTVDGLRAVLHKELSIRDSIHNRLQLMKEDKMNMYTALGEIGDLVYASMSDHVLDGEYARLRGINERLNTAVSERDAIIKRQKNVIHADSITIVEQMHKIEDLPKEPKMEITTTDHLDDTLTKRIVDLNGITKELCNELAREVNDRIGVWDDCARKAGKIVDLKATIDRQHKMLADYEKTVQRLVDSNKDDRTIVDGMNNPIREQNTTIDELKVTGDQRTIHLQKMRIDEQKETILRLVKEVKELRDADDFTRKIRDQDKIIDRQHKQIREHCETIGELRTDVGIRDKIIKILDSDAEYWRLIQDENHVFIHRLLDDNNTFNGVLDDCRADVKDRNKTIEQLERNLHDTNTALDESRKIAREYHKKFTDYGKQIKMEIAIVDHLDVMLTEELEDKLKTEIGEVCCIKYPIDEIWGAEDAIEASESEMGL